MASPIAGNESFTNVENVAGQLKVLDVNNLASYNLTAEVAVVDPATVVSTLTPTLEGLTYNSTPLTTGSTATVNTLNLIAYLDGADAVLAITLPAATVGARVAFTQNGVIDTVYSANDLTFTCAAGETFTIGNNLVTTTANVLAAGSESATGNNTLTYAGGTTNATQRNIFQLGCTLMFHCTVAGTWNLNIDLITSVAGLGNLDSTFAFSTV